MDFGATVHLLGKKNKTCSLGERNVKEAGLDKGCESEMQANKALASRAPELALCQAEKARPFHRASQSHRHRMPGERHDLIQDTPLVPGQILCC